MKTRRKSKVLHDETFMIKRKWSSPSARDSARMIFRRERHQVVVNLFLRAHTFRLPVLVPRASVSFGFSNPGSLETDCWGYVIVCFNRDYKQLLDEVFAISGIIKVEVSVISRRLSAEAEG